MAANTKVYQGLDNETYLENGKSYANTATNDNLGAVPTAVDDYITVTEEVAGFMHKTTLTCAALPITLADEAGQGQYGGVKVYDFPAGLLCTLGAVIDGSVTLVSDSGTWTATWNGDVALGTAAPSDHATGLVAANTGRYLQSTATTQAVALVGNCDAQSTATGLTESGARWTDGTATAADLYLNLLVDDAALHADGDGGTFTGTIEIVWMIVGDN